jgi:glyoxylase I family protein
LKIEHIAFNVAEASKMAQWYVAHLGLQIVRDVGDANQTTFIADDSRQAVIELYNNPLAEVPDYASINPFILHIAFLVDNIESERDRLLTAGATPAGDINTLPSGDKLLFLRDPWGVTIQLVKRAKPLIQ